MPLPSALKSLTLPLIAAPMFLVSGVDLVIETCKAGIVGTFPSLNGKTSQDFEQMLIQIQSQLTQYKNKTGQKPAPFGVNIIVHKSNPRAMADLQLCIKHKVPLVITSLGAVKKVVSAVHQYGGLVFHDVIKKRHAEKAAQAGVDGIIAVAAGAGGHAGTASPFAFVKEIRNIFKGTLVLAGGLSTGGDILAAQQMGADMAYMGTRFMATKESLASPDYKEMLTRITINDLIYTDAVTGVSANFIKQTLEKAGINPTQKNNSDFIAIDNKAKAWKDIWSAGHGVANIKHILPTQQLIHQLKSEYFNASSQH